MKSLKLILRYNLPGVFKLARAIYYFSVTLFTGKKQHQIIFEKIYHTNSWLNNESRSGSGSSMQNTATIRDELPLLAKELSIKTFLDIPCGDFYWMQNVNLNVENYIGADIVADIIRKNREKYGNENRKFLVLDLTADPLPASDLILCRDCLPHLSYRNIFSALNQIKKSSSVYLLTSTYINQITNRDIETGLFRPLNLQLPPFNFPKPLKLIKDKCIDEKKVLEDKMLGLWRVKDV